MKIGVLADPINPPKASQREQPASPAPSDRFDGVPATPPRAEAPAAAHPPKSRLSATRRAKALAAETESARPPVASPAIQSPFASPAIASPFAAPAGPSPAIQSPFASPFAGPSPAIQSPFAGPSPAIQSPFASPFAGPAMASFAGPELVAHADDMEQLPQLPAHSPDLERRARAFARRYDPNIKQAGWQVRHGGARAAHAYAMGYWRAALRAAKLLHDAPSTSLDHTLRALGRERQALAIQAMAPDAGQFGKYIDPKAQQLAGRTVTTPIAGNYLYLAHVGEFVDRLKRLDTAHYGDFLRFNTYGEERSFIFCEPLQDGRGVHYLSNVVQNAAGEMTWNHAYFGPKPLVELERLFTAAQQPPATGLSPEARLDDVCARVGKLHYFLAHHCPFERGSAGVSDMLSTALLLNHGYEHAGWKENVSADVVALVTPSSAVFAKMYRGLMAPAPSLRS